MAVMSLHTDESLKICSLKTQGKRTKFRKTILANFLLENVRDSYSFSLLRHLSLV